MTDTSEATATTGKSISIRNATKIYGEGSANEFEALKPVSMEIEPGEFVSIVGPSGCGKSTLMLMVAGLLSRSSGDIEIGGHNVTKAFTDIGIAFQDHLLLDFRTALDNVLLQADIRRLDKGVLRNRALDMFKQLHLESAVDKYPRQMSGGMRQRVSLVRTIVHEPPVLMLDEPFGALDALTRLQVRTDLESLWLRTRPTVLFITHSVEEAVGLSDRIFVMSPNPGRIIEEISVDLPRPRPISLAGSREFAEYADHIYALFEEMGVLHGMVPATHGGGA
ncbi:NitT/TauT family transport system ATP-binding protein [Streptomyces sp. 846.5]|nr:ABC transporter ATP-binding protein [Streptomyces sp. 846.5]TDU01713.1 NitT/TauT family transport system ATP-binding protein [Streptomyces sp. 846.5]